THDRIDENADQRLASAGKRDRKEVEQAVPRRLSGVLGDVFVTKLANRIDERLGDLGGSATAHATLLIWFFSPRSRSRGLFGDAVAPQGPEARRRLVRDGGERPAHVRVATSAPRDFPRITRVPRELGRRRSAEGEILRPVHRNDLVQKAVRVEERL